MKKLVIFYIAIYASSMFSQNNLYLKKQDSIFIIYDTIYSKKNIVKEYSNIKLDSKQKGINSIYFLMDSTLVEEREKTLNRFQETEGLGSTVACLRCFGLYFVHNSISTSKINQSPKLDPIYVNYKKNYLDKENVSLKDTLDFDKLVCNMIYYRYYPPISTLQLTEKELKVKNKFYFDGSTEKYNELKELLNEPHYLFMLDKKWVKQQFNSKVNQTKYYIFNEVMYRSRTRSGYPELRNYD